MAGDNNLHGHTDKMQAFNPAPPEVNITSQGPGQAGMPEATAFHAAQAQAEARLQTFVNDARQGFAAYVAIADGAAQDYLHGDNAGAAAIVHAANTPGGVRGDLA